MHTSWLDHYTCSVFQPKLMLITSFIFLSLATLVGALVFQVRRSQQTSASTEACLFETKIDPPFLRPIVTRLQNEDLLINAPVVHAKLTRDILVLDIKSGSHANAEGFEIALTEFNPEWLKTNHYRYHETVGKVLVGPQGDITNRLLQRTATQHNLQLPESSGHLVQAFQATGVVTDPAEFLVKVEAELPCGACIQLAYDYAAASLHIQVPANAFGKPENFQPLGVQLRAA